MTTTVVHLKRKAGVEVVSCDVYIGRAMYQGGWRLPASKWANPYRLNPTGTNRAEVLEQYREYLLQSPGLVGSLPELKGKSLGCWCVGPKCLVCGKLRTLGCGHLQCHGEVLIELLIEFERQDAPDTARAAAATDVDVIPMTDIGHYIDDVLELFMGEGTKT